MKPPAGAFHRWRTCGCSEALRAIDAARQIAHTAGRRDISPADLARGILREKNTLAARLLREHVIAAGWQRL